MMQERKPYFRGAEEKIHFMAVWVRIACLPMELMNINFLEYVGDYLGKSLKVDMNSVEQSRGKFCENLQPGGFKQALESFD